MILTANNLCHEQCLIYQPLSVDVGWMQKCIFSKARSLQ